ncbi:acyl-CoA dehydrogenase family protein [Oceanobacillus rekensis]|uniref:acyl-CoA dehydrogenase family protein n=1 Tax=Oceanobacillus rekensis TaxID=937927 RepID=UPI000B43B66C|nr:acyl-CoA dehydrogenase family protein [Oceanobacillus rekensis]
MEVAVEETETNKLINPIIKGKLKPYVRKIDTEAYYAEEFLKDLGKSGLLESNDFNNSEVLEREMLIAEETSKTCMTTGFNLWCHLASLTYLRNCDNDYLKRELLPSLEKGDFLGGTGLSNPMKYFANLEPLHLKAERTKGGYTISGNLPSVSNLKHDHWFGVIALNQDKEIMAFVPCDANGLTLKEKANYIGVNGSATYACKFDNVFIPDDWIISFEAKTFVENVRSTFVLYQIPLGLGVIAASVQSMKKAPNKQDGVNKFLSIQPEEIEQEYLQLKQRVTSILERNELKADWEEILQLRLDVDKLTIKAVHGDMLHYGGAAYLQKSNPSRRLREAYFLLNLTPTEKHLEKLLS